MKKVLMTLALVAAAATSAFAQLSVGAGYLSNTQTTTVTTTIGNTTNIQKSKNPTGGFYAGADYGFDLGQGLGISAGLKAAFLFASNTESTALPLIGTASATTKSTEIYLTIPVLFNYNYAITNDFKVFAFAGPSFAVGLLSKANTTNNVNDDIQKVDFYGENSDYGRSNLFLGAGVGIDLFNTVRVKAGYDIGLLNRSSADNTKINDAQLNVGVAYLF